MFSQVLEGYTCLCGKEMYIERHKASMYFNLIGINCPVCGRILDFVWVNVPDGNCFVWDERIWEE